MESRTYSELLEEMKQGMIAGQSKITDFNEGSVIMTLFESVARPVEQGYIDTRNGYVNNLRAIPYSVFDFKKKEGVKATVDVQFIRNKATDLPSTIPSGTRISNGSLYFITTGTAIIQPDETVSNKVGAIAEEVGLKYNLAADTITTIESSVAAEIVGVTNPYKAVGGMDAETDTEMLRRFKYYINGLQGSNKYGIMAGVLAHPNVRSVGIAEHFPPTEDFYNFTVYVDDGTGRLEDDLKNELEDLIDGTDTDTNPGLRAAGVNCDIQAATPINVTVSLTAKIYRAEEARVRNDIITKLQEYINGLGINENVVLSSIIVLVKQIPGVTDVSDVLLRGASNNVIVASNQIARFDSAAVVIENQ